MKDLVAFTVFPFVGLLAPFLVLPIVARTAGPEGWAAIAVGQSAGLTIAIVILYGWNLTGPVEIARASNSEVGKIYGTSLVVRGFMLVAMSPILAILVFALDFGADKLLVSAMALAVATGGFSPSFVAIGLARPGAIAAFDLAPKLISMAAAFAILYLGGNIIWYPICILLGNLTGVVAFSLVSVRPVVHWAGVHRVAGRRIRDDRSAAFTTVAGSAYSSGAILVVGLFATTAEIASVASIDRLMKVGVLAIGSITNALQAWVVDPSAEVTQRRQRRSLTIHSAIAVLGFTGMSLLGPFATRVLFGKDVQADGWTALWYGVAFAALAISSCIARHYLLISGDIRALLWGTFVGAGIGIPALAIGAAHLGAAGAAGGFALSEIAVLAVLTIALRSVRAKGRS